MTFFDCFSGLGVFSKVLTELGYENVGSCDINNNARIGYRILTGHSTKFTDIKTQYKQFPDFEILCAGFPCQPFSRSGKRLGFEDQKSGNLFYYLLELIDLKQPNHILLENVKGLTTLDKGETFEIILEELTNRNYNIYYQIINANHYSAQKRERVYIYAYKHSLKYESQVHPPITLKLLDIIQPIEEVENLNLYLTPKELQHQLFWRAEGLSVNGRVRGALKFPDSIDRHVRCLTATQGVRELTVIEQEEGLYRKLSALEYCRAQGFEDSDYESLSLQLSDNQIKKLVGNSINIPTLRAFVKHILL